MKKTSNPLREFALEKENEKLRQLDYMYCNPTNASYGDNLGTSDLTETMPLHVQCISPFHSSPFSQDKSIPGKEVTVMPEVHLYTY